MSIFSILSHNIGLLMISDYHNVVIMSCILLLFNNDVLQHSLIIVKIELFIRKMDCLGIMNMME